MNQPAHKNAITRRLIFIIIAVSLMVTAATTLIRFYLNYTHELSLMESELTREGSAHLGSIIDSLWKIDRANVELLIGGICQSPYIQYAGIEYKGHIIAACGTKPSGNVLKKDFNLLYNYNNRDESLGVLQLVGSKDAIWSKSISNLGHTLFYESISVLLVAIIFYFIFQSMVTRHLIFIADNLTSIKVGVEAKPIVLNRTVKPDELQDMVLSINSMQQRITSYIGELKSAEEALRHSEESYRKIFENAVIGVYQTSPEGRIIKVNRTFAQMFGYDSPAEIMSAIEDIGKQLYLDPERRVEMIRQLMENKDVTDFEAAFRHKSGGIVYGKLHVRRVCDEKGNFSYLEGFIEDTTAYKMAEEERDKLEAQLVKAQKIEAIGTLAGGIAHNFNNILTAILGNLSLGLMQCDEKNPLYKILVQAEEATLKARSLSQKLLTFAKGGVPNRKTISLPELIKQSAEFATTGASARCKFFFPDVLWPVEADPDQLTQVINNLVINALQAMPGGGTIKVGAENITLTADSELPLSGGRYVRVYVQDQGVGIAPDIMNMIFDPYFTTKESGTGLGLTSAYSIIKRHGGHITAESNADAGATFSFYLPAAEGEPATLKLVRNDTFKGEGKLLIMDDEEMVREIIATMAAHLGYESECARDGAEAIALFQKAKAANQPFIAVIMDLTIPSGMGGKETLKELLAIDPHIKAIVSSGYSDDPVMAHYKEFGFSGAIKKPYRIATFSKVLLDCLKS